MELEKGLKQEIQEYKDKITGLEKKLEEKERKLKWILSGDEKTLARVNKVSDFPHWRVKG